MTIYALGELIAERKLTLVGTTKQEISIKMGKPQSSGQNDYFCPVQILGLGSEKVHGIVGIDAFQAIQLAMEFIGHMLMYWNEANEAKVEWESDEKRGLGFPFRKSP